MLALAACSGGSEPESLATPDPSTSSAPSTTAAPETTTTTTTTLPEVAGVPADFARTVIELDGVLYNVAVADDADKLSRGLMFVEDLSPLDGMLFDYGGERNISHWMKNTLIPLDIAFFDARGRLVSKTTMVPCVDDEDEPCPVYPADGPAAFSVEVPAGGFDDLSEDAQLVIIGSLDGNGKEI